MSAKTPTFKNLPDIYCRIFIAAICKSDREMDKAELRIQCEKDE